MWLSQSVSQLGSAMTSFALILWIYTVKHSALTVSLMSFCSYVPYILISPFAGTFVDRHSKKKIMLIADSIALGKLVPQDKLANVSGMNSFSGSLTSVLTPVLAATLFAIDGLSLILFIDLVSFAAAFLILLFVITIPEDMPSKERQNSIFSGCKEGFRFLWHDKGILMIVLTMALLNFFSRLTYENILSPMLLSRSGDNSLVLGIVNAIMGLGGILGGLLVSAGRLSQDNIRMIYVSAALSFGFGDLLMGIGQNVILYKEVPPAMQGRLFAVRNAIQYSTIPLGILLGGFLADYVFEPFMQGSSPAASILQKLVGTGSGNGMAVMFLCTGILGLSFSILSYFHKDIQAMRRE